MDINPLYIIGPSLGVLAWAAIVLTWIITRSRRGDPEMVLKRLDSIDARLSAVEKTLNDIP